MKIFQGFEALQYIMDNKDKKLYTKNDQIMYYKDGIKIKGKYRDTTPIIDEHNMKIKWYTENKQQFNVRIYHNKDLIKVLNQYIMNTEDNIKATRNALLLKCSKELNISEDNFSVVVELIHDIEPIN